MRKSSQYDDWTEVASATSYSSNSSFSGSCASSSSLANWEDHVAEDGSLFYAEYLPMVAEKPNAKVDFARTSIRRNKNKVSRFVKGAMVEHKLANVTGGELKELELVISAEDRYRFGRRSSALESILGFTVTTFVDGEDCLMVTGFVENSTISQQDYIFIGDWFRMIDDIDIRMSNVEDVLLQYTKPTKVTLKFQGRSSEHDGFSTEGIIQKIVNFEMFAKSADKLLHTSKDGTKYENELSFAFMLLATKFSDSDSDTIFCYPPKEFNSFYKSRGSFLTLNSVLCDELKTQPICSVVSTETGKYFVNYRHIDQVLILLIFYEKFATRKESQLKTDEFLKYLEFAYASLNEPLRDQTVKDLNSICDIFKVSLESSRPRIDFEQLLPESRHMTLPKEAQLRIFDALSEMEAMDYRNWNDEPLNSHREFFMFGSALFYDAYLLASHLPVDQLLGVESFLRCRGVFDLMRSQNVQELVAWEVIPMAHTTTKYFLAICSRQHLLIAVILQAFEAIRVNAAGVLEEKTITPSLFYIEEIQETLDHLRLGGIESLARVWSSSNKRPAIETNLSTECATFKSSHSVSAEDVRVGGSSIGGSSILSLTPSEDSNKRRDDSDSASDWDGFPDSQKSSRTDDISAIAESLWKEVGSIVPTKLTAGHKNALLYYVHLDSVSALIITPMEEQVQYSTLIKHFRLACHRIHSVLQNTKKFRKLLSQESGKPPSNKGLVAIKEHGVTFDFKDDTGNYNGLVVAGRLFTSPTRELYVCHRPDVPQNLVEIAFRLSFLTAG